MAKATMIEKFDTLILGAGAAGLAAADVLRDTSICILEARNRIGGRILTRFDSLSPVPIELGAEFVHGAPRETLELVERAGLGLYDVLESHLFKRAGILQPADATWSEVGELFSKLNGKRRKDRSFLEFLNSQKNLRAETRALALSYAEGFHAGRPNVLSEIGLATAERETPNHPSELDHADTFRISQGYRSILSALNPSITKLRLNRHVRSVDWSKGRVEVRVLNRLSNTEETYRSKRVIITLPLGVLAHQEAPRIDPYPKVLKDALIGLRMGSAIRITFRFRRAFWSGRASEPIGMLHLDPRSAFPTWWTTLPFRTPIITGWAGGPRALEAYAVPKSKRIRLALDSLAELFDISVARLGRDVDAVYHHDWQRDPYTRGAYSHVAVNGDLAARRFSNPVDQTIYFAGEATVNNVARGTVDGAIASGQKAARLILKLE